MNNTVTDANGNPDEKKMMYESFDRSNNNELKSVLKSRSIEKRKEEPEPQQKTVKFGFELM